MGARTPNISCSWSRTPPRVVRTSQSVVGTAIPMQSKGYGSSFNCLANPLGFLRFVGDMLISAGTRPTHLLSSFRTFKDKSAFLQNSLSSLRCFSVATFSAGIKEEDSRWRSFMPKVSITLGVEAVGN